MKNAFVLKELARLEAETRQLLCTIDTSEMELRFAQLIQRACAEHHARHELLESELKKSSHSGSCSGIQLSANWNLSGEEANGASFSLAESAELRLEKLYTMARSLATSPLVEELAAEQTALKNALYEAKRSITWKMRAIS